MCRIAIAIQRTRAGHWPAARPSARRLRRRPRAAPSGAARRRTDGGYGGGRAGETPPHPAAERIARRALDQSAATLSPTPETIATVAFLKISGRRGRKGWPG